MFVVGSQPTAMTPYTSWNRAARSVSRTSPKAGSCRWQWLSITNAPVAGHDHATDQHGGRHRPGAHAEIVADALAGAEHLQEVARLRHLPHPVGLLAVFDPPARPRPGATVAV